MLQTAADRSKLAVPSRPSCRLHWKEKLAPYTSVLAAAAWSHLKSQVRLQSQYFGFAQHRPPLCDKTHKADVKISELLIYFLAPSSLSLRACRRGVHKAGGALWNDLICRSSLVMNSRTCSISSSRPSQSNEDSNLCLIPKLECVGGGKKNNNKTTLNVNPHFYCKHLARRHIFPQSAVDICFCYPINLCTCNNTVQWNLCIHKACHWKAQFSMNADWLWSPGCCNKTWASGPNFYFEIIKIASFFSGVAMVILSCSNAILI